MSALPPPLTEAEKEHAMSLARDLAISQEELARLPAEVLAQVVLCMGRIGNAIATKNVTAAIAEVTFLHSVVTAARTPSATGG